MNAALFKQKQDGTMQYFNYLVDHKRSTVQIKQDGTIIITPSPPSSSSSSNANDGRLPTEIFILILSQLNDDVDAHPTMMTTATTTLFECTLVSKHFYFMANPLLWKKITLDNDPISERFLTCLLHHQHHHHHVRHLKLDNDFWTDMTIALLIPHLQSLTRLDISAECWIETHRPLEYMPMHCRYLEQLKLDQVVLSPAFFVALGHYCRQQLTHLTLLNCEDLPSDLLTFITACPLMSLTLRSDRPEILNAASIRCLHTDFPDLTKLDIELMEEGATIRSVLTTTTTTTVWPRLTNLRLTPCNDVDDALLSFFLQSYPHLTHLTLLDAEPLTQASLDGISTYLRHLRHLTLGGVHHLIPAVIRHWLRTTTPTTPTITTGMMTLASVTFSDCANINLEDFPESTDVGNVVLDRLSMDKIRQSSPPPPSSLQLATTTTIINNSRMN